ncbi:uracil phosphoribosyltransferase, partial [Metarhizium hybridum]
MAVQVLKARGVPEDHILFLNIIASPEGVNNFATKFPRLKVVTAFIDQGLDEKKYDSRATNKVKLELTSVSYIIPGLGDFGDRFYTI